MTQLEFIVLALATWRIANLFVNEDGPWMMFEHIRLKAGLQPAAYPDLARETDPPGQMPGTIFACLWCASIYVAAFFLLLYALHHGVAFWVTMPFALSGVACLIDRSGRS